MKLNWGSNSKAIFGYSICIFVLIMVCSCTQVFKNNRFDGIKAHMSGEFIGIIAPPQGRSLKNLVVIDSKKRIVVNVPELAQNKIVILSRGDYEFRADGVQSKVFTLQDDCKITSNGKTFTQNSLKAPPAVAFRLGQRWDIQSLVEGSSYYLTILDMDNLNSKIPVSSYSAKISGNGITIDVPLNEIKENSRIISAAPHAYTRGSYTVTVSVNGDTKRIPPMRFDVIPKPPFSLTINNIWEGSPLQFADMQCYRSDDSVKQVMTRSDFELFVYKNEHNLIRINGERIGSTGENGRSILQNVHDNDRIIIMLPGINSGDDVYTRTITADESQKTINLAWTNVPSKGNGFSVQVHVEPYSMDSWSGIDNFSVSMYYRLGKPATIPSQTVLAGNGFSKIDTFYRREDSSIVCFADLSRISKVSHFNYLLRVDDDREGTFMMNNTSDEISTVPEPLRRQD